ncbi:UDP-3-O-(3-hydroxymyristoyl)glucosamine N-acyltransferase [Halarcobacter bivalviorum]|uniref:UDP-3-O-(3-hydroxymyristoyl)glucosamine N-acyltransferase n=1 Tax=Halarcobacter bivalviorum TaxID=663364 RepID=UPI0013E99936|nr:UDP-3-O-(3-hydroxymyristoyl)glucosamine N-acyltransferase [Halarcobacter bivalviorum]
MLNSIHISDISKFLNNDFTNNDYIVDKICSISNLRNNSIAFVNKKNYKFDQSVEALVIAIEGYEIEKDSKCNFIFSKNPRLDFVKVINKFFINSRESKISETVKIGANCTISDDVAIGEYTVIKDNVTIGSGTIINNHVVIESNTIIGENCYIKSGAIIGEDGFGFERDENGVPLRFSHIGNVIIGNNVEIGSQTTIARGTLESTVIKDNVKIDDQVHIAHNCCIGMNTLITACSEISGSVTIGKNTWIGPNTSIKDGLIIGENVFLGIGTLITKNVKNNEIISSLSNLSLKNIVKINKIIKE